MLGATAKAGFIDPLSRSDNADGSILCRLRWAGKGMCASLSLLAVVFKYCFVAPPPASVDLTTQGNTDWIHWGRTAVNDIDRKATGLSQISTFTKIGTGTNVVRLTDSPSKYSWTDGSPTAVVTNNPGGVYINNFDGAGRGFQFTVPAELI